MADTINISCPNCETLFEVPEEMIGEMVECTECGTAFEVVALEQSVEQNTAEELDEQVAAPGGEQPESTNTVKMSRTSIGMVPTVQDSYQLGVVDQQIDKTNLRKAFESGEFAFKAESGAEEGEEQVEENGKSDKKWWKVWGKK